MKNIVQVKSLNIGKGIPKICIPIVGINDEDIIEEVKSLKDLKFDLVEWRVDFYKNCFNIDKVKLILRQLNEILKEKPILFTFRTKEEGGETTISLNDYMNINCEIAQSKLVHLIDIELFRGDNIVRKICNIAHENNVAVIISNHDFEKTPSKDEIVNRLIKMINLNADLPKIAVMPKNPGDVLTLLEATNKIKTDYNKPIITMSMSDIGMISRIAGETFGSVLTFGASKKASAPGQLSVNDLYNILEIFHKAIK